MDSRQYFVTLLCAIILLGVTAEQTSTVSNVLTLTINFGVRSSVSITQEPNNPSQTTSSSQIQTTESASTATSAAATTAAATAIAVTATSTAAATVAATATAVTVAKDTITAVAKETTAVAKETTAEVATVVPATIISAATGTEGAFSDTTDQSAVQQDQTTETSLPSAADEVTNNTYVTDIYSTDSSTVNNVNITGSITEKYSTDLINVNNTDVTETSTKDDHLTTEFYSSSISSTSDSPGETTQTEEDRTSISVKNVSSETSQAGDLSTDLTSEGTFSKEVTTLPITSTREMSLSSTTMLSQTSGEPLTTDVSTVESTTYISTNIPEITTGVMTSLSPLTTTEESTSLGQEPSSSLLTTEQWIPTTNDILTSVKDSISTSLVDFTEDESRSTEVTSDVTTASYIPDDSNIIALAVGASIGAAVAIALLVVMACFLKKRREERKRRTQYARDEERDVRSFTVSRSKINDSKQRVFSPKEDKNKNGITNPNLDTDINGAPTSKRNYFQHGMEESTDDSSESLGDMSSLRRDHSALPMRALKSQSRFSLGPVLLGDDDSSSHAAYDKIYGTHNTFQ